MKISKLGAITIFSGAGLTFLGAILPFYSLFGIGANLLQVIWGWFNLIFAGAAVFFAIKGSKMTATIASGVAGLIVLINFFINSESSLSSYKGAGYYFTLLAALCLIAGAVVFYLTGVDNGEGIDIISMIAGKRMAPNQFQNPNANQFQNPGQYQDPSQYQNPGQYQDPSQYQDPNQNQ